MRRYWKYAAIPVLLITVVAAANGFKQLRAALSGYNEVPAVSTAAQGLFNARVSDDGSAISYTLTYSEMQGNVTQAHIHFGQKDVNGGIAVWLCSNLASPPTPAGVQPCPSPSGTVSGTITATDVVGPTAQGIAPGEFAELLNAVKQGTTYVNVHSTTFPGGEIRSQIGRSNGKNDHDDH